MRNSSFLFICHGRCV